MILETGRVERLHGDYAWVACTSQAGCARCAEGRGCGAGLFGRLLGDRLHRVKALSAGCELQPGDRVELALHESALVKGAAITYGLPLIGLIGLPLLLTGLTGIEGDGPQLAAGASGLLIGLLLTRRMSSRIAARPEFQPTVTRRLGRHCDSPD